MLTLKATAIAINKAAIPLKIFFFVFLFLLKIFSLIFVS
jgi:hypothetical protein